MIKDQTFWDTIGRTMYFTVASVGLEMVGGMAIAQLIHSHPWGWKFLRFSLIIPWAVPTIVNGAMWRWIYNADFGALNGLLMQLGLDQTLRGLADPARTWPCRWSSWRMSGI